LGRIGQQSFRKDSFKIKIVLNSFWVALRRGIMKSSSVQLPRVSLSSGAPATSREAGDIGSGQHVVYLVRHSERMDEVHSHALQLIRTERDYFGY
jgi:hypothetical protein